MRKSRRLTREQLAPFVVELPGARPGRPPGTAAVPAALALPTGEPTGTPEKPPTEEARAAGTAAVPGGKAAGTAAVPGGKIDWRQLFGNDRPVEVEVGFGKGLFLLTAALARPDRNFLGVEVVRKYQLYAAERVAVRGLPNVKTCCADAKVVLRDYVPAGSVADVHVYFPDPWWKKRHKKRLLFTPDFAESVLTVLAPGGQLHFASDVADYFAMVTDLIAGISAFRRLPPPMAGDPRHDMDYLTNFERKFRKEGRPIHRDLYEKAG